jgi:hypothetical protein
MASHKNPAQQAAEAGDLDTLQDLVENHGALDRPALQKWQANRTPTNWYSHHQCPYSRPLADIRQWFDTY